LKSRYVLVASQKAQAFEFEWLVSARAIGIVLASDFTFLAECVSIEVIVTRYITIQIVKRTSPIDSWNILRLMSMNAP
jgi:hypothetical protein